MNQIDEMLQYTAAASCEEMKVASGPQRIVVQKLPEKVSALRAFFNQKMDEIEEARQMDSPCFHNILVEFYSKGELMSQMVMTLLAAKSPGRPTHFIDALVGSEVTETPGYWHNKKV